MVAATEIHAKFHSSSANISRIILVLFSSMECHQEVSLSSRKDPKDQQKLSGSIVTILQPRKSCSQPDGLYAYFVCFCGFLSILIAVGCSYSYGLLFPVLLDEFKEGKAKTGTVSYSWTIDRWCIFFGDNSFLARESTLENFAGCEDSLLSEL